MRVDAVESLRDLSRACVVFGIEFQGLKRGVADATSIDDGGRRGRGAQALKVNVSGTPRHAVS